MAKHRISRRRLLVGACAAGALSPLLVPAAALAEDNEGGKKVKLIRWDTIEVTDSGVILPNGSSVAKDAATGDTVTLIGSGQAEPPDDEAAGGGTFVHMNAGGTELAHGLFFVTGLHSWQDAGGSLDGLGLQDGIGEIDETGGGVLAMDVHLVPSSGDAHDGVLTIHCSLPGSAGNITEGVSLTVAGTPLDFVQDTGDNLFHILRGGD
jgi:hypothetical protein